MLFVQLILFFLFYNFSRISAAPSQEVLDKLNANNDHGFWLENNIDKNLRNDWSFRFHNELRRGSDYRLFWYQEYTFILQKDITKWLGISPKSIIKKISIGPGYNSTYQLQKNILKHFRWVYIAKPIIEGNFNISKNDWDIKQRFRDEFHYYTRNHYHKYNLLRYRLEIFTPWKLTKWKFRLYVSNEWFYRKNTFDKKTKRGLIGGWHQNRFRVGLEFELFNESISNAFYWMWRTNKQAPGTHPRWFNTYDLGFVTTIKF